MYFEDLFLIIVILIFITYGILSSKPLTKPETKVFKVARAFVVTFFCLIIFQILIPDLSPYVHSKTSTIKMNMITLQTMVETFAVDNNIYPPSIEKLKFDAKKLGYWKEIKN